MVDINTYRMRIGCHNCKFSSRYKETGQRARGARFNEDIRTRSFEDSLYCNHIYTRKVFIYLFITLYLLSISLFSTLLMMHSHPHAFTSRPEWVQVWSSTILCCDLSPVAMYFIKLDYIILLFVAGRRMAINYRVKRFSLVKTIFGRRFKISKCIRIIAYLVLAYMLFNFLLIAIVNPSLLNPGPLNLKVSYQNVQGLIPFSNLSSIHPSLDRTKLLELNAYLHTEKPAVLMLNETWLKKSIKDNEIIENSCYNIYRSDRSQLTHPADPNNPNKFRRNGGGVLIAIRSDLEASINRISMRRGAEIVAIEITINNCKFIFCTVYRVGTLGQVNHESIVNSISSFF